MKDRVVKFSMTEHWWVLDISISNIINSINVFCSNPEYIYLSFSTYHLKTKRKNPHLISWKRFLQSYSPLHDSLPFSSINVHWETLRNYETGYIRTTWLMWIYYDTITIHTRTYMWKITCIIVQRVS